MINRLFQSPVEIRREAQRQAMINLLNSMDAYLPDLVSPWRNALLNQEIEPGCIPGEVAQAVAASFYQYQQRLADLQHQVAYANLRMDFLTKANQELSEEPVRQLLKQAQEDVKQLSLELQKALANLQLVQERLATERSAHQQEEDELRAYIQAQNRIIAQQQLRLNQILGETPGAETPGNL